MNTSKPRKVTVKYDEKKDKYLSSCNYYYYKKSDGGLGRNHAYFIGATAEEAYNKAYKKLKKNDEKFRAIVGNGIESYEEGYRREVLHETFSIPLISDETMEQTTTKAVAPAPAADTTKAVDLPTIENDDKEPKADSTASNESPATLQDDVRASKNDLPKDLPASDENDDHSEREDATAAKSGNAQAEHGQNSFLRVPYSLLMTKGLKATDILLYSCIADYERYTAQHGKRPNFAPYYVSVDEPSRHLSASILSELVHINRNRIPDHLEKLVKLGLLERAPDRKYLPYQVAKMQQNVALLQNIAQQQSATKRSTTLQQNVAQDCYKTLHSTATKRCTPLYITENNKELQRHAESSNVDLQDRQEEMGNVSLSSSPSCQNLNEHDSTEAWSNSKDGKELLRLWRDGTGKDATGYEQRYLQSVSRQFSQDKALQVLAYVFDHANSSPLSYLKRMVKAWSNDDSTAPWNETETPTADTTSRNNPVYSTGESTFVPAL